MRNPLRPTATILSLSLAVAAVGILSGCGESDARAQARAHETIERSGEELRRLVTGVPLQLTAQHTDEELERLRRSFGEIASRLERLDGATAGQQAAASLLRSSAQMQMGRLETARLQHLQQVQVARRAELLQMVETGSAIARLAASTERFDPATERAGLESARRAASGEIAALRDRIGSLERPIEQLNTESRRKRDSARTLAQQERSLRQDAAGRGHAAGFPTFMQAIDVRQQANELNIQAARNEIQVAELEPERDRAVAETAARQTLLEAIASAESELAGGVEGARARAAALRDAVDRLHREAQPIAEEIAAGLRGPIAESYRRAVEDFERAVQSANRAAADPSGAATARIAALNARKTLASVHMSRLLDARDVVAALPVGLVRDDQSRSAGALARTLAEIRAKQVETEAELRAAALESLTTGIEATTQLGDRPVVTRARAALTDQLAMIDRTAAATADAPGAARGDGTPSAASGLGGGLESPEDVIALLQRMDGGDPAAMTQYLDTLRATGAEQRMLLHTLRAMVESTLEFSVALAERFGPGAIAEASPAPVTFGDDLRVGERADRQATIVGSELDRPIRLVRTPGGWLIELDSVIDPELAMMLGAMSGQIDASRPAIERISNDHARRVRDGEYATAEAAAEAFQTALMTEMMGGLDLEGIMQGIGDMLEGMDDQTRRMLEGMMGGDGK